MVQVIAAGFDVAAPCVCAQPVPAEAACDVAADAVHFRAFSGAVPEIVFQKAGDIFSDVTGVVDVA